MKRTYRKRSVKNGVETLKVTKVRSSKRRYVKKEFTTVSDHNKRKTTGSAKKTVINRKTGKKKVRTLRGRRALNKI